MREAPPRDGTSEEGASVNKERLLNVAKALRESPDPGMFTMSLECHPCGTPACAWGHYAARADLQDEFCIRPTEDDDEPGHDVFTQSGALAGAYSPLIDKHFDITMSQAIDLFSVGGCNFANTAIEAAEYIEAFVARNGEP
jgi:hypothetical protein